MVCGLAHNLWCRREQKARLAFDSVTDASALPQPPYHYQTVMVGGQAVLSFPNLSRGPL